VRIDIQREQSRGHSRAAIDACRPGAAPAPSPEKGSSSARRRTRSEHLIHARAEFDKVRDVGPDQQCDPALGRFSRNSRRKGSSERRRRCCPSDHQYALYAPGSIGLRCRHVLSIRATLPERRTARWVDDHLRPWSIQIQKGLPERRLRICSPAPGRRPPKFAKTAQREALVGRCRSGRRPRIGKTRDTQTFAPI